MNYPRSYGNMDGPRMFPGPRMGGPYFPTYNRSRVHQDFQFAENPDLDGNFWVGPLASKDTTPRELHHAKQTNKDKPIVPKQLPKVVEKEPVAPKVAPKNPEEKKTTENPKDATNNAQNQKAIGQPQNSGAPDAAKKKTPKKKFRKRAKKAKAKKLRKLKATSQPQNSGVTKSAQQPIPAAGSQLHNPKADAAEKQQQPMPKDVSVTPEATNSQQPNPPCVNQPKSADDVQQNVPNTQNGDNKKRDSSEMTRDADLPHQPYKKQRTEEADPPVEQVDLVKMYGLRGDTSAMYSCDLCQYHTLDEKLIQIHFATYKHKEVIKHLRNYLPGKKVKLINAELLTRMKMSLGQRNNNANLVRNAFRRISPTHYLHRIEATYCEACGILIPDDPGLLQMHTQSFDHKKNIQVKFLNVKTKSLKIASQFVQDYNGTKNPSMGQHSFKDTAASSAQTPFKATTSSSSKVNSTPDVLVPEEDDDDDGDEDDDEPNGEDFSVNLNEDPVDEEEDCDMMLEPDPVTDGKVEDETEEEAAEAP